MKKLLLITGVILGTLAMSAALLADSVSAQYPPPVGSLTVSAGSTAVSAGGSTAITCTVRDTSGEPIADVLCAFGVLSQPGNDASISPTSTTTGDDGTATAVLSAGSTPGTVVVEVDAGGITSQVSVRVASRAGGLPTTGGPPPEGPGTDWLAIALAVLGGSVAIAGGAVVAARARRS